jgi:hypothetical protein
MAKFFHFMDSHSGGGKKFDHNDIYVEACCELSAKARFKEIYNHDPDNVTCQCCGRDFSVYEVSREDVGQCVHFLPEEEGHE